MEHVEKMRSKVRAEQIFDVAIEITDLLLNKNISIVANALVAVLGDVYSKMDEEDLEGFKEHLNRSLDYSREHKDEEDGNETSIECE